VSASLQGSRLAHDLHLNHRDSLYRALTFLARHGGLPVAGDTLEELAAQRQGALDWLDRRNDVASLVTAYEAFTRNWSPVFPE
jgi:hypothetical protein